MPQAIIDMHQHPPAADELDARGRGVPAGGDREGGAAWIAGAPPAGGATRMRWRRRGRIPSCLFPFFAPETETMTPDDVTRARDEGFAGLKFIAPGRAYNDPGYFPIYARAAELGMPALFHLGIVSNSRGWTDVDNNQMRPVYLDHIARTFPELRTIGAHFGNPWSDEAAMCCRWNMNPVFRPVRLAVEITASRPTWASCSGGGPPAITPRRTAATPWEKIVFGSDVDSPEIVDMVDGYTGLMDALELAPELREAIWYNTAARCARIIVTADSL